MAKVNPAMLVPAAQVADFAKNAGARSIKDVALGNIQKMKHLFQHPDEEGKRNFEVKGENVEFTIRVGNTPLVLAQVEGEGGSADVTEMAVPKAAFADAMDFYLDKVKAGEFDAQLKTIGDKRAASRSKGSETRAASKAAKDSKPAK